MNKKIKVLIDLCTEENTSYFDGRGNVSSTYFDKEKFAGLIIKECADLCVNLDGGENMFSRGIQKHFGIE